MDVIFSVIIPTYNRKDTLKKCLNAVFTQTYPNTDYEVIVIDDGSTDGTEELVNSLLNDAPCALRYFKQENKGPAAARNVGIKNAKGEIILFTGDDCIADSHLIEKHMKYHNAYKDVVVLGHTAWHSDLEITPFMEYITTSGVQFGYPLIKNKKNVPFNFFYTSNISVGKKHLMEVGLFDENFKYAAWEDIELGYRLVQNGIKIIYNKNAITYHHHFTTLNKFCERQKISGISAIVFWKKHPEFKSHCSIYNNSIVFYITKMKVKFFSMFKNIFLYKYYCHVILAMSL
ncbi:glycosyl transferase [Candidatus Atribacteria bacterium HGW-Atribacteria-1]|nr:MAG: glycosyl transferase [Candidatus Atribacteria bacterium HGW-Atribacteria-1]